MLLKDKLLLLPYCLSFERPIAGSSAASNDMLWFKMILWQSQNGAPAIDNDKISYKQPGNNSENSY
jgi:hypothetical protein